MNCPLSLLTVSQIAVATDVFAIGASMTEDLKKSRGSYGHAALNMAKGMVYGTAGSLSSRQKDEGSS